MYKTHAIACQQFCQQSADNLEKTILMVSASIKQPWHTIGIQLNDIALNGLDSRFLEWKMKKDCYSYMKSNKHFMYAQFLAVLNSYKDDMGKAVSLMNIFTRIDGINTAKAGFICQLSAGLVGCIDSHNHTLYGINPARVSINKRVKSSKGKYTNAIKISDYIKICHKIGTSRLWDTWCNARAIEENHFKSGYEVSEAHIKYLTNQT